MGAYRKKIDECNEKLEVIKQKKLRNEELLKLAHIYARKIKVNLLAQNSVVNNRWTQIKEGKEGWSAQQKKLIDSLLKDVTIKGVIRFGKESFLKAISDSLNKQKFRAAAGKTTESRIAETFPIENFDDYIALLSDEKVIAIDGGAICLSDFIEMEDYFVGTGCQDFLRKLFLSEHRKKYITVLADIRYKNKSPENELSVGQKGTFYLCLKLATDSFSTPFVFDQPEDDLDNDFIVEELVPIFREIKQFRQVIIVTHNANLVINADAEQIIVADNEDEELTYYSGSIENLSYQDGHKVLSHKIKEHVCKVLEGGRDAFDRRQQRYFA